MASYSQNPSIDTYIANDAPTTNHGTEGSFFVGEWNGGSQVARSLVKFDLSSIPAGSLVTAASLTLTIVSDFSDNARTLSVYRVLRAWNETQATWNVYTTGNNWGTAGCANTTSDRESSAIGTATQPNASSGTVVVTLNAASIQEMITGGVFTNNGFLLQVASESNDMIGYGAREATLANRPVLAITYSLPNAGAAPIFFA